MTEWNARARARLEPGDAETKIHTSSWLKGAKRNTWTWASNPKTRTEHDETAHHNAPGAQRKSSESTMPWIRLGGQLHCGPLGKGSEKWSRSPEAGGAENSAQIDLPELGFAQVLAPPALFDAAETNPSDCQLVPVTPMSVQS